MSLRLLLSAIALLSVSPSASSQASIQDLLGLGPASTSGSGSSVYRSAAGEWRAVRTGSQGLDCAVGFYAQGGASGFLLIGPTPDGSKGTLVFLGAQLPAVDTMTETRVALVTDKDPAGHKATPMKAFQVPSDEPVVAIATDMTATLRGISDVKRVVLKQSDAVVFDLAIDGVFTARDALAKCMGMPPIGAGR